MVLATIWCAAEPVRPSGRPNTPQPLPTLILDGSPSSGSIHPPSARYFPVAARARIPPKHCSGSARASPRRTVGESASGCRQEFRPEGRWSKIFSRHHGNPHCRRSSSQSPSGAPCQLNCWGPQPRRRIPVPPRRTRHPPRLLARSRRFSSQNIFVGVPETKITPYPSRA
jgi:hypothetical protein